MHRAVPGYPLVARRRRLSLIGPKGSFRVRRPIYTFGHQRPLPTGGFLDARWSRPCARGATTGTYSAD